MGYLQEDLELLDDVPGLALLDGVLQLDVGLDDVHVPTYEHAQDRRAKGEGERLQEMKSQERRWRHRWEA